MVEALQEKRAPLRLFPKFYFREPEKGTCDDWLIQAYYWLCSERNFPSGPIPWSKRMEFADANGLSYDVGMVVAIVVGHLDKAAFDFETERAEKERKGLEATKGQKPGLRAVS